MSDNFLVKYVNTYAKNTESPTAFHVWTALSTLASVAGRKVWFDHGFFKAYPNLYIVLVAPPGKARKSTALKRGRNLLKQLPTIHFSSDSITLEAMYKDMEDAVEMHPITGTTFYLHCSYTAHISELKVMLRANDKNMVTFLTDIYDCGNPDSWEYKTKHQGVNTIDHPYFNLLAATTPGDVGDIFDVRAVAGGLTSRIIFVYSEEVGERIPFGIYTDEQKKAEQELVDHLELIYDCYGKFDIAPDARDYYAEWYRTFSSPTHDPRIVGYYERKHMHTLKVAMLSSLSRGDSLRIEMVDLEFAFGQLQAIEPGLIQVFAGVGGNDQVMLMNTIKNMINERDFMREEEIVAEMFFDSKPDNTKEVLKFLATVGYVKKSAVVVDKVKGTIVNYYHRIDYKMTEQDLPK